MKKEIGLKILFGLILVCLSPATSWAEDFTSFNHSAEAWKGDWIELQRSNPVNIPNMTLNAKTAWRYPYDHIPVYSKNQTVKGIFHGSSGLAGSRIAVSISSFDASALVNAFMGDHKQVAIDANATRLELNSSGDASFALNNTSSGMYTIFVFDENKSTVLSALPLLVTAAEMSLDAPAKIAAGDVLTLKANLSEPGNFSKIFAAVMISRNDFENASLSLNGTEMIKGSNGLNTTLSLGNKSMIVQGIPEISSELLMQIITLLPRDSAVGMQETKGEEAEIILITDPAWEKGNYVLIGGVYSPGKGLLSLREKMIELT